MEISKLLDTIPEGLRGPLISEYNLIVKNYLERRWLPSELSAGRFCEIVYCIIEGKGKGSFPSSPTKPSNFIDACRRIENFTSLTRSLRILIPRMLPSLYEIRNNRNVGHVGGDVDSNEMDSTICLSMATWIMCELIRVFNNISITDAQIAVDFLTERRVPLIWSKDGKKRILNPNLKLPDQILILATVTEGEIGIQELLDWLDYHNPQYFSKILSSLHKGRLIEFSKEKGTIEILPPGITKAEILIQQYSSMLN